MDLTQLLSLLGQFGGQGTAGGSPLQNLYYAIARLQGQPHDQATLFSQQASQQASQKTGGNLFGQTPPGVTAPGQTGADLGKAPPSVTAPPATGINNPPATWLSNVGNTAQPAQPKLPSLPHLPVLGKT